MKKILKIAIIWILLTLNFWAYKYSNASSDIRIPWSSKLEKISVKLDTNWDISDTIKVNGIKLLTIAKIILHWLLLIFIIYAWWQMIMSMWDNEEQLSSAKRQIWYALIAIIFINIPGSLYEMFNKEKYWNIDSTIHNWDFKNTDLWSNLIINPLNFGHTFEDNIIWFIKLWIYLFAVVMFIIAAYKVMMARWHEETLTKAKEYLYRSVIALVFAWMIDVWRHFIFSWSIHSWINIFSKIANIALFFAWPIAIFFLTLAWYYYITSNWDEEKVKKSKNIVVNTLLWTLILLASYSFLLDLNTL